MFDFEKRAPSKRGNMMVDGGICRKMSQAAYRNPYDFISLIKIFDSFDTF